MNFFVTEKIKYHLILVPSGSFIDEYRSLKCSIFINTICGRRTSPECGRGQTFRPVGSDRKEGQSQISAGRHWTGQEYTGSETWTRPEKPEENKNKKL